MNVNIDILQFAKLQHRVKLCTLYTVQRTKDETFPSISSKSNWTTWLIWSVWTLVRFCAHYVNKTSCLWWHWWDSILEFYHPKQYRPVTASTDHIVVWPTHSESVHTVTSCEFTKGNYTPTGSQATLRYPNTAQYLHWVKSIIVVYGDMVNVFGSREFSVLVW